jgi:hypothetical protein
MLKVNDKRGNPIEIAASIDAEKVGAKLHADLQAGIAAAADATDEARF